MKSANVKKINFAILILFPVIMLIFLVICNLYSINLNNNITKELNSFTNSLSSNIEGKYLEMISLYFGEQLKNYEKAEEITNLAKEQIRLGINPNFSTLKFSINRLIGNSLLRVTYVALFLLILMFALILFLNYTNNSLNTNPVSISNDAPIDNDINKNEIIEENNKKRERENKNLVATNSSILKKQEEKKLEEIESMYRDLVIAIKNSNDEKALEILENIFSIDEKNYLALNGAGILYTRMYSKNNKSLYFRKADKYYESAISIYDNKDILNNKAVLYSTRYGIDKSDYDYNTALTIFDNMIYSSNNSDFILLNNRATIYLAKYNITGNNELFENALKDYEEIIKLDNRNVYALNNRSSLYFNKYKKTNDNEYFEKSIQDCSSAFKIDANEALKNDEGPIYIYKY
ncbi:hypothetical protein EPJ64_09250 [Brachyspira aalborgi]|jgi:tetratricopeptide (TPR) repeat protein|uniref:Tetratricopeptide repeat protein n=1 Tax=Brachyspira aalborgi TaxID=29522 RepID=A0ABY3K7Y2_9SPIR|nr:tPR domain-containing protein [Brachyspira aalborgi]MBS4763161.1 hypothetical protein [Brachyspira sp.]CCY75363.1 tPR domain-containing protein [Brachyspira sp. CAG:700]TXJ15262.1 hypothetical protein EPJ77_08970 [Brachyspira aalborgi]TXJ18101.1 hypothetical protein EPJ64_09250 [Brachyspira aalborgi]TXJ32028.1 hypothetical protein EPJ71_07960 [Brachyspira aalborgi]